jgi:predicted ATPase
LIHVDLGDAHPSTTMRSKTPPRPGPYLLNLQLLREKAPSFDQFPFCLPAVRNLDTLEFHPKVSFFIGENGSGKSTLLEAIAIECGLNPEGGSRNFRFSTCASHSSLDQFIRLAKAPSLPRDSYFLRAESFYNLATEIERLENDRPGLVDSYGGRSLHRQSHGESFFALFENRFGANGLYLLDEPEAALSPSRQLSFLTLLHRLCRNGSQFVIATHSPIIMAYPDAWIYALTEQGAARTRYEDTEHYRVTQAFLSKTKKMLSTLLDEKNEPLLPG